MTDGCFGAFCGQDENSFLLSINFLYKYIFCFGKNAGILVGWRGRSAVTDDEEQEGETTRSFFTPEFLLCEVSMSRCCDAEPSVFSRATEGHSEKSL